MIDLANFVLLKLIVSNYLSCLIISAYTIVFLLSSRFLFVERYFESFTKPLILAKKLSFLSSVLALLYFSFIIVLHLTNNNDTSQFYNYIFLLLATICIFFLIKKQNYLTFVSIYFFTITEVSLGNLPNLLAYLYLWLAICLIAASLAIYNKEIKLKLFSAKLPYRVVKISQEKSNALLITLEPIYMVGYLKNCQFGSFVFVSSFFDKTLSKKPKSFPIYITEIDKNNNILVLLKDSHPLAKNISLNQKFMLQGPYGQLLTKVKQDCSSKLVVIAEDETVSAFYSLITQNKKRKITLIYFAKHHHFKNIFRSLAKKNPPNFHLNFKQIVNQKTQITELAKLSSNETDVFVTGSKTFIAQVSKDLSKNKIKIASLKTESLDDI